jgi:hypothetical protein
MSPSTTVRLAGVAMLVGAAIAFVTALYSALVFVGSDPMQHSGDSLFVPVNLIQFAAFFLVLLGLPVAFVAWQEKLGPLGLIGMSLVFLTGLMFGVFFSLFSVLVVPYIAQHAPSLIKGDNGPPGFLPFFIAGTIAQIIGCVLLAIPILRGLAGRRWIGVALLLSAVTAVPGFLVGGPSSSGVLVSLVQALNELFILVALMGIGYQLWSQAPASSLRLDTTGGTSHPLPS